MRKLEVLLLCDYRPEGAATVCAHINALSHYSRHNVHVLSIFGELPVTIELQRFDVLIVHYSLVIAMDAYVSRLARQRIRQFKGLKAIFIQDEYRWVNDTIEAMRYLGIDMLFTCVPEAEIEKVYPASKLPKVAKVNVLTGYVPDLLAQIEPIPYASRPLDVGYRARRISAWFGDLGQEKWQIAARFVEDAKRFGLKVDLSYNEADRLYGSAWTNFIRSCRAVLGIESGANVFDFTGELQKIVEAYEKEHPEASYEEIRDKFLIGLDHKIRMNQISPRCFEAAALRTLMILYEGEYSGILKPWQHYVPLKKDHSNVAEVIAALREESTWRRITDAAYHEVASNPAYSYQAFVNRVDDALESRFSESHAAIVAPYTTEEFSRLSQQHAMQQRPIRIIQRFVLFIHHIVHRYFLQLLSHEHSVKLKRTVISVYHSVLKVMGIPSDIWRRVVFIVRLIPDAISPGFVGVGRDLSMLKLHGRWRGVNFGLWNLLQELDVLKQLQLHGTSLHAQTGCSPFVLIWIEPARQLELHTLDASADGTNLEESALLDVLMKGGVETFCIRDNDRWGIPDTAVLHAGVLVHSTLPAFSRLIKYYPRHAWRLLFKGPYRDTWVRGVQVLAEHPRAAAGDDKIMVENTSP